MSQESFMGAEDFVPSPTDIIISDYENKISQNIASKTLSASKHGKAPEFTKEELLYLNRKAGEDEDTELKVITPAPLVTLKKGKTELNIGHAVKLVQKMEEKYPTGVSNEQREEIYRRPFVNASIEHGIKENPVLAEEEPIQVSTTTEQIIPAGFVHPPIKTVNKNAYEIRGDVLKMSLEFFKWQTEMKIQIDGENGLKLDGNTLNPTTDNVLEIAQKFYKFVENRR